jgi:hypothetical protein
MSEVSAISYIFFIFANIKNIFQMQDKTASSDEKEIKFILNHVNSIHVTSDVEMNSIAEFNFLSKLN